MVVVGRPIEPESDIEYDETCGLCQKLDFPVNISSSMPAARNHNFTLVPEFLALQAIWQCPW
jgi:hypothetical protein